MGEDRVSLSESKFGRPRSLIYLGEDLTLGEEVSRRFKRLLGVGRPVVGRGTVIVQRIRSIGPPFAKAYAEQEIPEGAEAIRALERWNNPITLISSSEPISRCPVIYFGRDPHQKY